MSTAARTIPARYGSPGEVAARLGLSVKTVRRQIAANELPAYRVGRRVLVRLADAEALVRNRAARTPAPAPAAPSADEAIRALAALDAIGDDREHRESLLAAVDALDGGRPPERRRFRPWA
jgi:excisionase family DNA binding protein